MPDRKKKKRKSKTIKVANLYNEDIGFEGLKKSRITVTNDESFRIEVDEQEESRRRKRMNRFVDHNRKESEPSEYGLGLSTPRYGGKIESGGILTKTNKKLEGTSTALEKSYMRLTTAPKAQDVRPLPVLRNALSHVQAHFVENEDFEFANEQLKSIRQDITVQHIRNSFVLKVYETHARILLEHGDLNEFNQCQTMIRSLTSPYQWDDMKSNAQQTSGSKRKKKDVLRQSEEAADEFRAYSLLYDVVQNSWCDLIAYIRSDVSGRENEASSERANAFPINQGSSVRHALKVVKAILHDDYMSFFRLYESAPHMSAYLMDYLVRRIRDIAYTRTIAAYRPTISTQRFREILCFHDLEETRRFLKKKGVIFVNDSENAQFWVDCKATFSSYLKNT